MIFQSWQAKLFEQNLVKEQFGLFSIFKLLIGLHTHLDCSKWNNLAAVEQGGINKSPTKRNTHTHTHSSIFDVFVVMAGNWAIVQAQFDLQ